MSACQQHLEIPGGDSEPVDEIIFRTADPSLSAEVATKATAVTSLSSFNVSAVTGSAGSETAVWTNVSFTGNNDAGYKADKWWPAEDASYRFYASNSALSFAASGATVAATNATDVICAYAAAPSYKAKNTLSFEHIFARLGAVTVSAATGYTISHVSIKITPKTGGTYKLLTGAGHTDGTGWSGLATGSETVIASATGSNANDIYLVPGTYTLTASWTAARGLYTENIQNMQVDVNLTAGKINTISTTVSGNAKEVVFSVSIAPWTEQNQVVEFPTEYHPSFAGLQIAPGDLGFDDYVFKIRNSWKVSNSYYYNYSKNPNSNYFSFIEIGQYFDSRGYSFNSNSGAIDNGGNKISYDGHNDWRLPTQSEWNSIMSASARPGANVNGANGKHWAFVILPGVYFQSGGSTPQGVLFFPDHGFISGKELTSLDGYSKNTLTEAELNVYLEQGCVFLPASGAYSGGSWTSAGTIGHYMSNSVNSTMFQSFDVYCTDYSCTMTTSAGIMKTDSYIPVRLVRNI